MNSLRFLPAVLFFLLIYPAAAKIEEKQALAIVETTEGASCLRAGDRSPLALYRGQLLFEGDIVLTSNYSATLSHCSPKGVLSVRLSSASEAEIRKDRVLSRKGFLAVQSAGHACQLPKVEEVHCAGWRGEPEAALLSRAGLREAGREMMERLRRDIQQNPNTLVARVSRALALLIGGQGEAASRELAEVERMAPDQDWTKAFQHQARRETLPAQERGRTFAIAIGISDYLNDTEGIRDLRFAARDASVFAQYLTTERAGSLSKDHIVPLLDSEATTAGIDRRIQHLVATAGVDDVVILFISAHGAVDRGKGYLLTHDSFPGDLSRNSYPVDCLSRQLRALRHRGAKIIVFADACRAGHIGMIEDANMVNSVLRSEFSPAGERKAEAGGEIYLLMASQRKGIAWEHEHFGGGHGAFSYFVLRGLNRNDADDPRYGPRDGRITAYDLANYVEEQVRLATHHRQVPEKRIPEGDAPALARVDRKGIDVGGFRPIEAGFFRSGKPARGAGEPTQAAAPSAGMPLPSEMARLIALEDEGQRIMLTYLRGDEVPQARQDFARGARIYEEALRIDPNAPELESRLEFFRGRTLIFDKNYAEAGRRLERAIRLDPGMAAAFNALGIAYLEQAIHGRAMSAFLDAIRRAPYWSYPRHNLALAHSQVGDYEASIREYRAAMALSPNYSYLPYNLGLIYQRTNRQEDAERWYLEALRLAAWRTPPWIALGMLRAEQEKYAEAERYLRRAVEMGSRRPDGQHLEIARHNLAGVLVKEGKWDDARTLWQTNLEAGYLPSRIALAEALHERGETAEAVLQYRAIAREMPEHISARRRLADLLDKLGRGAEARLVHLDLLCHEPENPLLLEEYGDFARRHNDAGEALRAYRSALESQLEPKARKRIEKALSRLR